MSDEKQKFPGGSRSRVNRAGANVRSGSPTPEDLQAIDEWRAAHRAVLNTFQAVLRTRTKGKKITVAQRHKRKKTIFDKLSRLPKMELARMDDVAGCRLIFSSIDQLNSFRREFHCARFNHKRRNDVDKYNYIKSPKKTGYRGVHDVYEYDVNSVVGKDLKGLFLEIQYRTLVQHAWSTAVEVIGFVTESQPKFQKGDLRYQDAMALASEILARAHEKSIGPHPDLSNEELVGRFLMFDQELNLLTTLRGLNSANKAVSENRNTILVFSATGELEIKTYRDAPEALRALFELEKQLPERDVVLVRADSSEDVRLAFRNYFSDAREFIKFIENGCEKLTGNKYLPPRKTKKSASDIGRQKP